MPRAYSGEFYTPRAVVRLNVAVTDPRLGETVLDPACGTGGFLVEAFNTCPNRSRPWPTAACCRNARCSAANQDAAVICSAR